MSEVDPFEAVLAHLRVVRRRGDRAEALCPAHDDSTASLGVARGDDQPVVMTCRAGCSTDLILGNLGLGWAALTGSAEPHVVESYCYVDERGAPRYFVDRWVPKSFRPRLLDGRLARPAPAEEVLYRLPEVIAARERGQTVYLVEGERDVETAREFGMTATTSMSGATQPWLRQFTESLAGAHVVIVADDDAPGRARARRLVVELGPYVEDVRAVLPRYGRDLRDHLLAGFRPELLDPLPAEGQMTRYTLAHVTEVAIDWAWEQWIPAGMITIVEGEPGTGKSAMTVDLASRWSTGRLMPDGSPNGFNGPVRVGMCSAEDDPARVIKPRLMAAGGNPHQITLLAGMPMTGSRYLRNVDLERDIEALREAIESDHLRVVIIDPIMAYLGSTRTAIDSEVRKVLTPLKVLAEETDCAIVAVRHLRKQGGSAVHAGGGSIAFTGQARSVLLVGRDYSRGDDEANGVLAMTKTNLGRTPKSLAYRIAEERIGYLRAARVGWEGDSELTADDLMRPKGESDSPSKRNALAELLTEMLGAEMLDYPTIRRRLMEHGDYGENITRLVLAKIAEKVPDLQGVKNVIRYRLKGAPPVDEPTSSVHPEGTVPTVEPTDLSTDEPSQSEDQTDWLIPNDGPGEPSIGINQSQDVPIESSNSLMPPLSDSEVIDSDEALRCTVCGVVEIGLLYIEALREWRCRNHPPPMT